MQLEFHKYTAEDRTLWEDFNRSATSTFLTSVDWIDFQTSLGRENEQFLIYAVPGYGGRDLRLVGLLYIEHYRRKIAKLAYAPYNPVIDKGIEKNELLVKDFYASTCDFFAEYVAKHQLNLFRFDPLLPKNHLKNLHELGFKTSLAPAQARDVWELSLDQSVDELRAGMSKSTRYNINKTQRSGIEIIKASNSDDVKNFSTLMKETTGRKNFGNFDDTYFQKQFEQLNPKGMTEIFLAKVGDRYTAGALINFYGDTAYYTHGCSTSDPALQKLRSPYFLQWEIMNYAQEKGFKKYNMWGVLPEGLKSQTNTLKGVSDFKKSFGGYELSYVGALELSGKALNYRLHRFFDWWSYRNDRY